MVSPNFESIPDYLKSHARICLWRYEERTKGEGDWTKVPYNPLTGRRAKSNDPSTFTDYETARSILVESDSYDGLGAGVFDGLSAIDIDHCVKDGELSPMAREIVEAMDTYTEVSPSGEGLHLFFLAPGYEYDDAVYYINSGAAGDKAKAAYPDAGYVGGEGLEVYVYGATKKYLTITGNAINGNGVEDRGDVLPAILERFMRRDMKPSITGNGGGRANHEATSYEQRNYGAPSTPDDLTDAALIGLAMTAENGADFAALWRGDTSRFASSDAKGRTNEGRSNADLALCNYLAFWTGRNASRMDSLFRQSGLMRDKWDERRGGDTYGGMTISKAIADCRETYTPPKGGPASDDDHGAEIHEGGDDSGDNLPYDTVNVFISEKPADVAEGIINHDYEETPIKTGFSSLDAALYGGLRSGLVTIGAISSAGKTTLLSQLGDHVAANGTPVLFCSIEQTARELVGKSLSRMMAQRDYKDVGLYEMESSKIRPFDMFKENALRECVEEYRETVAPYLTIMTAQREQPTIHNIETAAYKVAEESGKSPLVIVDYLQLIAPASDRMSDKQATDSNVSGLRLLANRLKTPVLVISSLNRASYNTGIERSSFKESGMVEYSSDLLLGLQPLRMKERINEKVEGKDGAEKLPSDALKGMRSDGILDGFMKAAVKECEIVFLKNRNGKMPDNPLPFTFYAASSLFVEGNPFEDGAQSVGEWFKQQKK